VGKRFLPIFVSAVVVVLGVPGVASAAPQDFTVNVTADHDDGSCDADDCTLREAINAANADAGASTISFDITGADPGDVQTMSVTSELPAITAPASVDGYTQPGASPNTLSLSGGDNAQLRIALEGSATTGATGLRIHAFASTVRGLVIDSFSTGIELESGSAAMGNFVGVDATGTSAVGNGTGIRVGSGGGVVGSSDPPDRNVVSGNNNVGVDSTLGLVSATVEGNYVGVDATGQAALSQGTGIEAVGSVRVIGNVVSGNTVHGIGLFGGAAGQGNLVGTDAGAEAAIPNGVGIQSNGGFVGGPDPGMGNVISGNTGDGVIVIGTFSLVQGNWIGTSPPGDDLGNDGNGVLIPSFGAVTQNNIVKNNVVAFNDAAGIAVKQFGASPSNKNGILGNSMYSNGGLGIDLGPAGVTPNDADDADSGANDLQNYPELTEAVAGGGETAVLGTLTSTPSTQFDIDVFSNSVCDPSGHGEGRTLVGTFSTTTGPSGSVDFDQLLPVAAPVGHVLTATATAPNGSTSEFSTCRSVARGTTDLSLTNEDSPNTVVAGANVTYTLTVSNHGGSADGVSLADSLPKTASLVSVVASQAR
jgi:CSLREA domain-containing protein/uncharacterized repeat protein (TIGR01451 family)